MEPMEQLGLFKYRAKELQETKLLQTWSGYNLTIKASTMEGMRIDLEEPDEDYLRSFLLTFRQFLSNDEPVFLNKIYNICHQRLR